MYQIFTYLHVLSTAAALLGGLAAFLLGPKGGKTHLKAGKYYVYFYTGVLLTAYVLNRQRESHRWATAARHGDAYTILKQGYFCTAGGDAAAARGCGVVNSAIGVAPHLHARNQVEELIQTAHAQLLDLLMCENSDGGGNCLDVFTRLR